MSKQIIKNPEKTFTLKGKIKVKNYGFRKDQYGDRFDTSFILYNEKGEHFVLCVDTAERCCEDFNLEVSSFNEDEVISDSGITISISEIVLQPYNEDFEGYLISVKGSKKELSFKITNEHNGYYSHTVKLDDNGRYIWERTF